jgi:hypothetical protein
MMPTNVFERISKVRLEPRDGNSTLRFHLTFQTSLSRPEIVQFDLSSDGATALLYALKGLQAKHGWRMPSYARPSNPPTLTVVSDDD